MKNINNIIFVVMALLLSLPEKIFAQSGLSFKITSPVKFPTLEEFILGILDIVIIIATPVVVIFIILAGFKYVTARGNANAVKDATQSLTYAIIGGILIIGAIAIARIIENLIGAFAA